MPPNTNICRLCLSDDVRTIAIADTPLQLVYEKLTSNLLHTADMRPIAACYLCYAQLSKSYKLMLTSTKAENALTEILETYHVLTNDLLALKDRPCHSLYGSLREKVVDSTDSTEPILFEVKLEPEMQEFDDPCSPYVANFEKVIDEKYEPEVEVEKFDDDEDRDVTDPLNWPTEEPSGTKKKKVKAESDEVGAPLRKLKIEHRNKTEETKRLTKKLQPLGDSRTPSSDRALQCTAIKCETNSQKLHQSDNNHNFNCQSKFTEGNILKCNLCKYECDSKTIFQKHLSQHVSEKLHICHICQRSFSIIKSFKIHMAAHTRKAPLTRTKVKPSTHLIENSSNRDIDCYKCDVCQKVFDHKNKLRAHLKWHSDDRPYQCHACDRAFREKYALTIHLRIHTGEMPFDCDVCHRKFSSSSSYSRHFRIHTGEKPYECDICKRRFNQISSLKSHAKIHSGEKPHECTVCHHRFYTNQFMLRHLRTHTGERPYKCSFCHRRFKRDSHLKRHEKTHTGVKPHECHICHHRFIQSGDLKRHIRTHTGEKPFECNECKRRFKLKSSLIKHTAMHSSDKSGVAKNTPETS